MEPFPFLPPSYGYSRPTIKHRHWRRHRRSVLRCPSHYGFSGRPMASSPAYVVAARRSALGRVGGLHKGRRIEELSAPIVAAALRDSGLKPERVDVVILGNAS